MVRGVWPRPYIYLPTNCSLAGSRGRAVYFSFFSSLFRSRASFPAFFFGGGRGPM